MSRSSYPTQDTSYKKTEFYVIYNLRKLRKNNAHWRISGLFESWVALKGASGFSYPTQLSFIKKENFVIDKFFENWVTTMSFWTINGLFLARVAFDPCLPHFSGVKRLPHMGPKYPGEKNCYNWCKITYIDLNFF